MEQSKSAGYFELASKVENGQVVTLVINKNSLPSYLRVAVATGFKVEQIAEEGEGSPLRTMGEHVGQGRSVSEIEVEGKGCIAVSIERPKGSKDHTPFWNTLKSLKQKKV